MNKLAVAATLEIFGKKEARKSVTLVVEVKAVNILCYKVKIVLKKSEIKMLGKKKYIHNNNASMLV